MTPSEDIARFLAAQGFGSLGDAEALTGGVSSDIWRVATDRGVVCVKRALPKLRVRDDWFAPVGRNRYEARWYREANRICPGTAPALLAEDEALGIFAMEYFPPADHRLWKTELLAGRIEAGVFTEVGARIGQIHAATADRPAIARDFATDESFEALRLAPYLRTTAERHPDLAPALTAIADRTAATRRALVHGDLSPKNILLRRDGTPVLLDAECAWFGDPAFDPAFCLNHVMLKMIHRPQDAAALRDGFERFWTAYLPQVVWEPPEILSARTADLLAGLLLARIDGKSPVEYLTDPAARDRARQIARSGLTGRPADPRVLADRAARPETA
jgi:5-methylthioribose kinase